VTTTTAAPSRTAVSEPYRPFALRVHRVERLSTTFTRVTLTGAALAGFAGHGRDQRVNLLFLPAHADHAAFAADPDWLTTWRGGPVPMRCYTIRAFRPAALEVDIDFALHGDSGPASRWAGAARPGDPVVMVGATRGHPVTDVAWHPPADASRLLLAADETALPAAASILESLDRPATAFLEVPFPDDRLPIGGPARITWLVRSAGERLEPVVRAHLDEVAPHAAPVAVDAAEDDIWDVPEHPAGRFYAWLAGESGTVVALRRHLVSERGVDRRSVAFMGYWKRGRPQPNS
jgi:NADPH-dependent ferric siderophore reductase